MIGVIISKQSRREESRYGAKYLNTELLSAYEKHLKREERTVRIIEKYLQVVFRLCETESNS